MADIRKKVLSFVCASMLCAFATDITSYALTGDVNFDNRFDIKDFVSFKNYMFGAETTSFDESSADFDGNKVVDIRDFIMSKSELLNTPQQETETSIHLNGNTISVEGENVALNSSSNIATITASGIYYIDGKLDNGQICVNIPDETVDTGTVKLFFNGVDITGMNEAPVYIVNAENTSINLMEGTVNILRDGEVYTETEAALFAKDDLTLKGEGRLEIYAGTQFGIHCNNDLKINGADLYVETLTEDAVRGKTSVTIKSGNVMIDSEGDGIKSTKGNVKISGGTVSVKAGNDAVQAETDVEISGGTIIACGDRGIKSTGVINISGGNVLATATDEQSSVVGTVNNAMLFEMTKEWSKNNPVTLVSKSGETVFEMNTLKKYRYVLVSSDSFVLNENYKLYIGGINVNHSSGDIFNIGTPSEYADVNNEQTDDLLYRDLFKRDVIHSIEVEMPEDQWNHLIANAMQESYYPADITIDGEKFSNVGIRTKGNSSLQFVSQAGDDKFSLRIKMDEYDKYQNYHGLTEFCMNNMYSDPSCMRDALCYDAMYELDGYAPMTGYTNLTVNGSLYSFYFLAEQPGKTLAERYATSDDASLYKAQEVTCTFETNQVLTDFELKFGNDESLVHIQEVSQAINRVTASDYKFIEDIIDVESFLKGFAVNAVLCNYDSYNGMMAHNFYLMYDKGKMHYVGWDFNLALGNFMDYGASVNSDIKTGLYNAQPSQRPMITKLLGVSEYYDMYIGYVNDILNMYSDPEQKVNAIADVIRESVKNDPRAFFTIDQFEKNISKSETGLVVNNNGGSFGNWGGGFGNWGGGFGNWGGGFGGFGDSSLFSFGGDQVSVVDFMIKRAEVIRSAIGY